MDVQDCPECGGPTKTENPLWKYKDGVMQEFLPLVCRSCKTTSRKFGRTTKYPKRFLVPTGKEEPSEIDF